MSVNLSISFELVCLMGWLVRRERKALNGLVRKALASGLAKELENSDADSESFKNINEQTPTIVSDFFSRLESMVYEELDREDGDSAVIHEKLGTIVKKIDHEFTDERALFLSLKQLYADHKKQGDDALDSPVPELEDELLKVFLKNWKPDQHDQRN